MKTIKSLRVVCGLVLLIILIVSCKKLNEVPKLPAETQSGNNTFGCYIDGQLYLKGYQMNGVNASYSNATKSLVILSNGKFGEIPAGSIDFAVMNPVLGVQTMTVATFVPKSLPRDCFQYLSVRKGELTLTRFDIEEKVVSGRFRFEGYCADWNDEFYEGDTARITDGRFDIKLNIVDWAHDWLLYPPFSDSETEP